MKKRKIKRDYKSVLLHLLLLLIFVIFNFVEKSSGVFSVAVLATSITLGASIFITPLLFLFSFVLVGKMGMLASMAIAVGVILLAIFIYKGFDNKPKYELPLIVALSLVGYAVLGDTVNDSTLKFRIILSVVVAVFSLFM